MYKTLQNALQILCEGNENESNAAYGFCHHIAKEHPVLFLPHILTLAALLKERMPLMNQGEDRCYSFGHALYLVAGLLDALRPHIFDLYNSDQLWDDVKENELRMFRVDLFDTMDVSKSQNLYKESLEVMLDVYFEFLKDLDATGLPQFLKAIIRLTDFLCHCVAAGKHCLDIISRHRELIQITAHKFAKIKKLGFLLSLLDNLGLPIHSTRTDTNELLERQSLIGELKSGPPMLPADVVLKVQKELQHFLTLETNFSETGAIQQPHRDSKNPEFDIIATLDDIEKASARVPTLLTFLEESLVELTKVQSTDIQERLYQLLERLLLHCPSEDTSRKVMKALLHNLKSSNMTLARVAAQQAVRFFYHCPDLQETVLVELFLARSFAEEHLQQLLQDLLLING
eukprot:Gb_30019 [translate_table: standard]